ncbi:MAG TPA: glycosyltransferase family 2 protein [Candidatus Saccharimonadales bacterium]|jgi:GT2 family glycosyltransferase|nr:glycosyltransferase family 2 protein [Candidatus Saccharimonadales bacterium]
MEITVPDISIIVVNYNTMNLLRDCLVSLFQTDGRQCEVIVVDNASDDGSAAMVEQEFPSVLLVRNRQNLGFSKANNQGMRLARGRYFLLLNSDTVVRAGALEIMAGFMAVHAAAGAVSCRLLNADGSIQASISHRPGPVLLLLRLLGVSKLVSGDRARRRLARMGGFFLGRTIGSYLAPYNTRDVPLEVGNISGACLMLRREAVEQVGFLDEGFFMYFEDMDYCLRLQDAGWKMYYLPQGEVVHLVGMSSGGRMRNYSTHSYRALFHFYKKHFSNPMVAVVRCMVVAALSVRWVCNWIQSKFSKESVYRQNQIDLQKVIRVCFEQTK